MVGMPGRSGRRPLSDEEKRRRGTLFKGRSEADYAKRHVAQVVTGPWLDKIPEPPLPLSDVGRREYDTIIRAIYDQGRLTLSTARLTMLAAIAWEEICRLREAGKPVPYSRITQHERLLDKLRIAETPNIATPGNRPNKFAHHGFANRWRRP